MSQIIKAFMGVFLTLFMEVTAMGILAAYMEVMNAQDMQARIVDEDRKSTRLSSSHKAQSRMPSSA